MGGGKPVIDFAEDGGRKSERVSGIEETTVHVVEATASPFDSPDVVDQRDAKKASAVDEAANERFEGFGFHARRIELSRELLAQLGTEGDRVVVVIEGTTKVDVGR